MLNNLKKEFPNFVKKTENPDVNTIKIESDSEDSDIEMVKYFWKRHKNLKKCPSSFEKFCDPLKIS